MSRSGAVYQAIRSTLLTATAVCAAGAANAAGFDQFIGFGDSTMDSGYFRYGSTGGLFSWAPARSLAVDGGSSGGRGWRERRLRGPGVVGTGNCWPREFGLTALPVTIAGGGTNYANGSAQTVPTTQDDGYQQWFFNNVPIVTQISNYLAACPQCRQSQRPLHGQLRRQRAVLDGGPAGEPVAAAPMSLSRSRTPWRRPGEFAGRRRAHHRGPQSLRLCQSGRSGWIARPRPMRPMLPIATYGAAIWSGPDGGGGELHPRRHQRLFNTSRRTRPGSASQPPPCWRPVRPAPHHPRVQPPLLVAPNAEQTYLWADDHHLTTAGQTIEADYIYSLLTAPSQISLLAESAVQERPGAGGSDPGADRSVRAASWAEPRQRLGQRRGRQPDRQERGGLPQASGTAVRRHGGRRLSPSAGSSSARRFPRAA